MIIKVSNNIASFDDLISTLQIFGVYLCMHNINPPTFNIIQKTATIDKAINKI